MKFFTSFLLLLLGISNFSYAQYCTPTTDCSYGDGIVLFEVGTFSNTSACEADGVAGFGDFTTLTGLDLGQGVTYAVILQSGYTAQQISIWIDSDNDMAFDSTELILADEPVGTDVANAFITIPPSLALGNYRMRVQSNYNAISSDDACALGTYGETEDYTLNVVAPPSCLPVSDVIINGNTSSTLDVNWTENGTASTWDIEYGETGFVPTGTPSAGYDDIAPPFTITGLNPVTSYDVYVRADCGMDNSSNASTWIGPFSSTTTCATYPTPYLETFTDDPPNCWTEANAGDPTTGPDQFGDAAWFSDDFGNQGASDAIKINLYNVDDNDWLISPFIDLSTGGPYQVDFDFSITDFANTNPGILGSDDEVHFLISTDSGITWSTLQKWTSADMVDPAGIKIIHDLTPYDGMVVTFAFWGTEGIVDDPEDNDIFIDNFAVRTPPTCIEIAALAASSITDSSAAISWDENGSATTWDIEFDTTGFAPTGMPTMGYNDVSNPTTITGLQPVTSYDVYVRADCGMDNSDVAIWIGPFTFTTECAAYVAPYVDDFTIDPALCWSEATDGDLPSGPMGFGASAWFADGFGNVGLEGSQRINLYQSGNNDWLISPIITLTSGSNFTAEFDFAITAYATTDSTVLGSDDVVYFLISDDNGTTWTTLHSWTAADDVVDPTGEHYTFDLTTYDGMNVTFAFLGSDGLVDDTEDNDIFVDNFEVRLEYIPIDNSVAFTGISCNGANDASIDLTVTGGTPPYMFDWNDDSLDGIEDPTGLGSGEYSCTITDATDSITVVSDFSIIEPDVLSSSTFSIDETIEGMSDGRIDLTVEGGTPPYTYSWDNGETTEDIENLEPGTYCAVITDANGCINETCADVLAGTTSISNLSDLTAFSLFPNPVVNDLELSLRFSNQKDISIQVSNTLGQIIYRSASVNTTSIDEQINLSTFPTGIYFVTIKSLNDHSQLTRRIVKQ